MKIDIITAFPAMFDGPTNQSIIKKAQEKGLLEISVQDLRDHASDKHHQIDDTPYGGGPGMLLKIEPLYSAITKARTDNSHVILLTPQGSLLKQAKVQQLSKKKHLIMVCGHYEGVDERVRGYVDEEISIGDYILTGGELPAMVLLDAVARKLDGVLGSAESLAEESLEDNLLEYPQYTKPAAYMGQEVPKVLLSGNHQEIARWRKEQAIKRTSERRPDLLTN